MHNNNQKWLETTSHKSTDHIVRQYFQEWVIGINSDLTIDAKKNDIKKFLYFFKHLNGDLDLFNWTSLDTSKFLDELEKQGYKPSSINRNLATLKSLGSFMIEKNYLSISPTRRIKGPVEEMPPPSDLTDIEIHRLRKAAQTQLRFKDSKYNQPYRDKVILELFLGTGMRCSELANLKLDQVSGKKIIGVKCKGNRYRDILVKKSISDELGNYIAKNRVEGCDHLFTSHKGDPISRRTVYDILQKIAAQAKDATNHPIHIYPHLLRHVHAKRCRDKHGDYFTAKRLGHASTRYIERYAGHTEAEESKMIEELEL